MEGINGNGGLVGASAYGFSAKPQVIQGKTGGPYRDPYREYM
jgi:hypothetical protein